MYPERSKPDSPKWQTNLAATYRTLTNPDAVALRLTADEAVIDSEHRLVAPTLLRSEVLSTLCQRVQPEITKRDAERYLDHIHGLRIRLLGEGVLQRVAWKMADQLGWVDTFVAEYIALTQLQADAFVTLDRELARSVESVVQVAPFEELLAA